MIGDDSMRYLRYTGWYPHLGGAWWEDPQDATLHEPDDALRIQRDRHDAENRAIMVEKHAAHAAQGGGNG